MIYTKYFAISDWLKYLRINQLALTIFERCITIDLDRWYISGNETPSAKLSSRLSEGEIAELLTETGRKKCKCG